MYVFRQYGNNVSGKHCPAQECISTFLLSIMFICILFAKKYFMFGHPVGGVQFYRFVNIGFLFASLKCSCFLKCEDYIAVFCLHFVSMYIFSYEEQCKLREICELPLYFVTDPGCTCDKEVLI